MSEQNDSQGLPSESLPSSSESLAQQDAQQKQDAAVRQAGYEYQHANERYGGGRSLHAPDGSYKGVHFHYARREPARHRSRAHYGRREWSRGASGRTTSGGSWSERPSRISASPQTYVSADCVSNGSWWQRFWRSLDEIFFGTH